jgi:hypothetical protein
METSSINRKFRSDEMMSMAESKLYRYIDADPTGFRAGDIVEVQFTFIVIPIKREKHRMMMVLRALTLLDSTHTTVCNCTEHIFTQLMYSCRSP